ncbi:uncharacterized protein [Rutidosis leptorrhynchoides]|uniref:uncharacterized protein n=1 Tax=Rutidosis leptorrhynchoides TaxID=125765 RepID=UPI003A99E968
MAFMKKACFTGMLRSIDSRKWKNYPVAWKEQYTRGQKGHPTIILKVVASYGTAPLAPFIVNGNNYKNDYYLAYGIYPDWATLIKTYSTPTEEKHAKFKRYQERARKDVENKMRRILYYCVLLHNVIVKDNGHAIAWLEDELLTTDETELCKESI